MKKLILALAVLLGAGASVQAQQKAIYVKKGDSVTKYNFGVAGDLKFSDGGKTLTVSGYKEAIDLSEVDYISFSPSIDETALTPAAQKEKLLAIGEEANRRVEMNANADMIILFDSFFGERFQGSYAGIPIAEFSWNPDDWDIYNEFNSVMNSAAKIAKGNVAEVSNLRNAVVHMHSLPDYYGTFEANTGTKVWTRTGDADCIELKWPGVKNEKFSVRLKGSGEMQRWNHPKAGFEIPAQMRLDFLKDGVVIAGADITTAFVQDQRIAMNTLFTSKDYTVKNDFTAENSGITDNVLLKLRNEDVLTVKAVVEGKNILVYDEMYDAVKAAGHSHNEHGECMDDGDFSKLYTHFFRATSDIDLLGQIQVKAKAFNFGKLDEGLGRETDIDYMQTIDGKEVYVFGRISKWEPSTGLLRVTGNIPQGVADHVKYLNNYVDAPFYYDGTSAMQGYLGWGEKLENEDRWVPEDYESCKYGFVIRDGFVIEVRNELRFDEQKNSENWTGWFYNAYVETADDSFDEEVKVDDSEVLHPAAIVQEYYGFDPVIVFPDLTSTRIPDYFTRSAFEALVKDYDAIIDNYYTITGRQKPAPDPDPMP